MIMRSPSGKGIIIKNNIVLDGNPVKEKQYVFISHAHEDHTPTKKVKALTTPETAEYINIRKNRNIVELTDWKGIKYGLLNAGHVPGSKMIHITLEKTKILYTGDFSLHTTPLTKKAKAIKTDILIMDATYFHPNYILPEPTEVIEDLLEYINKEEKTTIFVYPFGKAQIIASYLDKYSIEYVFSEELKEINGAVEKHTNHTFNGSYASIEKISNAKKGVFIVPIKHKDKIKGGKKIGVSGWGKNEKYAKMMGFDRVFPYSDHADFEDLLRFIDKTKPEIIYGFQLNGNKHFFETYIKEVLNIYAKAL